jgi:hypothetical protein
MGKYLGYYIVGGAVLTLAGYLTYLKISANKAAKTLADQAALDALKPVTQTNKPVANTLPAAVEPTRTTGFNTTTTPTVGVKIYANTTGANAYKTASSSSSNLYKYYPSGTYIGTFLAKEGIYTKVAAMEAGIFGPTYKSVYVLTTNIKL